MACTGGDAAPSQRGGQAPPKGAAQQGRGGAQPLGASSGDASGSSEEGSGSEEDKDQAAPADGARYVMCEYEVHLSRRQGW